ncbi:MAG: hypothetical protein RIR26_1127 [Pseudomonadota bacterium]
MSPNPQIHLTNDSFLYACQSEFAARSKKDGSFNSHIRFEPFLIGGHKRPEQPTWNDFQQLVRAIMEHHIRVTPQFRRHEPLNLDTVAYFTCAIATLFADLETACKETFGLHLPSIPSEPPEYSTEVPVSKALLSSRTRYLGELLSSASDKQEAFAGFPLAGIEPASATEQENIWSCEIWDLLADAIHSVFGEYADTAMGFAYWKYQQAAASTEIDWRIRPPVGEAYAKAFKPLQRSARGDRPSFGGGGDRPQRDSRRERNNPSGEGKREAPQRSGKPERAASGSAERPREASAHSGERHQSPREASAHGGERHQNPRRHAGPEREGRPNNAPTSEEQLTHALQEVREAASQLQSNPNLSEVALKPSNSFIRRQQHSLAVELGLDTESRGEGRDRGVVLRLASQGPA